LGKAFGDQKDIFSPDGLTQTCSYTSTAHIL